MIHADEGNTFAVRRMEVEKREWEKVWEGEQGGVRAGRRPLVSWV